MKSCLYSQPLRRTARARKLAAALVLGSIAACGGTPTTPFPTPKGDPRQGDAAGPVVVWQDFSPAVFERARREKKLVLLDGSAEWCHFCHVMDETTYADPQVRAFLAKHFVLARVDIDARPDVEERYSAWGWPATIVFTANAEELGKYRGYVPAEEFRDLLVANLASAARIESETKATGDGTPDPIAVPLTRTDFVVLRKMAEQRLEKEWDAAEKGWGKEPKVPLGETTAYALTRALRGDATQREHALSILDAERAIIDPVWGGIYQYSVATDWKHPHFEKLMYFNGAALANYARAFALTKEPRYLAAAKDIRRYLEAFLMAEDGGFHPTQDADFNSHDARGRKMLGEEYFKKDDAQRRALGIPRVDPHEYADATAMAVAGYVEYYAATKDVTALDIAEKGAKHLLEKHVTEGGGVTHDVRVPGKMPGMFHLADAVWTAWVFTKLVQVSPGPAYLEGANRIAQWMRRELETKSGGFFAHTASPFTEGVFAQRRVPAEENMLAVRLYQDIVPAQRRDGTEEVFRRTALRALSVTVTSTSIDRRGKFLGAELLALDSWIAGYPGGDR